MAQAEPAYAGQTINGYRILGKLGAGGMGLVFRGIDTRLNRNVALKFLPEDLETNARSRDLLLKEAQAASALDHPNTGTIYGIEYTPAGRMFIVMAFYEGQTLAQKIAIGRIPLAECIRIATQIANGLAEAHAHHIVHRDIKPSNVLITPHGGVKILDFGLARVLPSGSVTQSVELVGTVSYMSPEQALGRALDRRTDLWSLGVTMYEMVSGRLPFIAENSTAMLMAILHTAPQALDNSIPLRVQRIIYKLLVKDPALRYHDIHAVQADLEALSEDRQSSRTATQSEVNRLLSLVARPISLGAQALSRLQRWSIAVVCLVIIGAVMLVIPSFRQRFLGRANGPSQHIAVLPIQTKSDAASDAEISDGLRESITDRLSNLQAADGSLWVVPANEVRSRKIVLPADAWKTFGADLVVLGRLERQGKLVRLTLELVDAKQVRQLGAARAENFEGDLSEVENTALAELESKLGLTSVNSPTDQLKTSVAPTAYESYLKALPLIDRWDKPKNIDNAIGLLQVAIKQDPKFALAFVSLANAGLIQYRLTSKKEWLDQATNDCNRGQQLNSQLPAVHVTMGKVQDASGRYDLALQEFKRALDLEPHNAEATLGTAHVYDHQGRTAEAEKAFRDAVALRPDNWDSYNQMGEFFHEHQRNADAIEQFKQAIELAPDSRAPYVNMGAVLIEEHRLDEAIQALQKASAVAPSYGVSTNLGFIYFQRKRFAEAERATEQALKMNDSDWRVWTNLATIRRWRKNEQKAQEAELRAIPLMENAVRVKPQDAELQADLSVAYADVGREKDARLKVQTALALGSGDGAIEAAVSEAYERLGEHQRAVALFKKALGKGIAVSDFAMDPNMQPILADREISTAIKPIK